MVAISSSTAPSSSQASPSKKTRRGGSAAKRQAAKTNKAQEGLGSNAAADVAEEEDDDDKVMIDVSVPGEEEGPTIALTRIIEDDDGDAAMDEDTTNAENDTTIPTFQPISASDSANTAKSETRRIPIPPHRFGPLKNDWMNIYSPLTEILGLQVRMNVPRKAVEIRVSNPSSIFISLSSLY